MTLLRRLSPIRELLSTVELFESRTAKYNEFSSKAAFLKKEIVVMQKEVLDYCKAYILSLTQ